MAQIEAPQPSPAPRTRGVTEILRLLTPQQMAEEIVRLDAVIAGHTPNILMGRVPDGERAVQARLWGVMAAVNDHMHPGSRCPGAGTLGECAAISTLRGHSGQPFYQAHLYVWPAASALEPATVAAWFQEAGCREITVAAVIHDAGNEVVNGVAQDGARPWDVSFLLEATPAAKGAA